MDSEFAIMTMHVPQFLQKLYYIVQDSETDPIV